MHRNTFINAPQHLAPTLQWRQRESLFFAGQMTGVEGYIESAATGLLAGINAAAFALWRPPVSAAADDRFGRVVGLYHRSRAHAFSTDECKFRFVAAACLCGCAARRKKKCIRSGRLPIWPRGWMQTCVAGGAKEVRRQPANPSQRSHESAPKRFHRRWHQYILCLIADIRDTGRFRVLDDLAEIARLGQGVDQTGRISADGEQRALAVLERYRDRCKNLGVEEITAVGTSALRDANNSAQVSAPVGVIARVSTCG